MLTLASPISEGASKYSLNVGVHGSYGRILHVAGNSNVDLEAFGISLTPRMKPGRLRFGLRNDFRWVLQTSKYSSTAGNQSAFLYTYASPEIGIKIHDFTVDTAFFIFGQYRLIKKTSSDLSLSYGVPRGFRITLGHRLTVRFSLQVFLERIYFRNETLQGFSSNALRPKAQYQMTGLGLSYEF